MATDDLQKIAVRGFWNEASCGERLYLPESSADGFRYQASERYRLEPYIAPFAKFDSSKGLRVLEIGVGLGADHQRFAEAGAHLTGIDLTPRAIELTKARFEALGLHSDLRLGDAENLTFEDNSFDIVYSWGVIHHSPDTRKATREIIRVLKPGGVARVMIYHTYSLVGFMLWLRFGLAAGKPLESLKAIYAQHLESPGTKAYTTTEARELFSEFEEIQTHVELTHGDLLSSGAGQRHNGRLLSVAKAMWPRWLLRRLCSKNGLFLLIEAKKPK